MSIRIGIDLGGTNLRGARFSGTSHTPVDHHKEAVGEPRDPEAIIERVALIVERLAGSASGPIAVGVGIAAMLRDRMGTVANSPHLRWRDVAFGRLLATRLGTRFRVGVYNDVNAIVWGEAVAGSARGARDVLGVYVGTGIGGGLIANGQLVEGATNCAGEIGHVKVRWDDSALPCACGGRGCVEAYVGGSYVKRRIISELSSKKVRSLALDLAGGIEHVHPGHVDQAAAAGDQWALDLWTELATLMAIALSAGVALLNPERLVLGGGLLGRAPTLFELVEVAVTVATPSASLEPLVMVAAELGDDAGLVGASALASAGVSLIE